MEKLSKAVRQILNYGEAEVEDYGFRIVFIGLREIKFYSTSDPLIAYFIHPLNNHGKAFIEIANFRRNKLIVEDKGDLRSMSVRKRLVNEVKKNYIYAEMTPEDRHLPETVAGDLENLHRALSAYLWQREKYLLDAIENGNNDRLKEMLAEARQGKRSFSDYTSQLLDCIDHLPVSSSDNEPSHEGFTLQQIAGRMGLTEDQVRGRLSPLVGTFVDVAKAPKGNQPAVYRHRKIEKEPAVSEPEKFPNQQSASTEEKEPPQARQQSPRDVPYESEGLVRRGEIPRSFKRSNEGRKQE